MRTRYIPTRKPYFQRFLDQNRASQASVSFYVASYLQLQTHLQAAAFINAARALELNAQNKSLC
jgi:hypothetical protein